METYLKKKKIEQKNSERKNEMNAFDTNRTSHNIHTTQHKYAQQQ